MPQAEKFSINQFFDEKTNELGFKVSAASGMAIRSADEDIRDAMKRADKEMYACKQLYYQQTGNDRRK